MDMIQQDHIGIGMIHACHIGIGIGMVVSVEPYNKLASHFGWFSWLTKFKFSNII